MSANDAKVSTTAKLPLLWETYDVGGSLHVPCVSASTHNALCSSGGQGFGTVCHTGLRVYDGSVALARLLSTRLRTAWVVGSAAADSASSSSSAPRPRRAADVDVLELGCGCGLAGLAALPYVRSVLFTDAQPRCLELVQAAVERNYGGVDGRPSIVERAAFATFSWDPQAASAAPADVSAPLLSTMPTPPPNSSGMPRGNGFDLVLAAELVYFFVDLAALMKAMFGLLRDANQSVGLFMHHNRKPQGTAMLFAAAEEAGLVGRLVVDPAAVPLLPEEIGLLEVFIVGKSVTAVEGFLFPAAALSSGPPDTAGDREEDALPGIGLLD